MTELELMTLSYDELIKRINDYTGLSRTRDLTVDEAENRQRIRNEYIRRIRVSLSNQMEGITPLGGVDNSGNGKKNN